MLRVPVAMAMTKLLLHLPQSTLTAHLPGLVTPSHTHAHTHTHTHPHTRHRLLLKVCETLKSRSRDVRDAARDTLVKMASALGPAYLPYIFKEMKDLLTRGYQVKTNIKDFTFFSTYSCFGVTFSNFHIFLFMQLHVLAYSIHSILNGLCPILKTGDLDPCLDLLNKVHIPILLFPTLSFRHTVILSCSHSVMRPFHHSVIQPFRHAPIPGSAGGSVWSTGRGEGGGGVGC